MIGQEPGHIIQTAAQRGNLWRPEGQTESWEGAGATTGGTKQSDNDFNSDTIQFISKQL